MSLELDETEIEGSTFSAWSELSDSKKRSWPYLQPKGHHYAGSLHREYGAGMRSKGKDPPAVVDGTFGHCMGLSRWE